MLSGLPALGAASAWRVEPAPCRAAGAGAHYLGIGPIAVTASKADAGAAIGVEGFRRVHAAAPALPAVAIGGITVDLTPALIAAGARGVAVIRAVLDAPDPESATRALAAVVGR